MKADVFNARRAWILIAVAIGIFTALGPFFDNNLNAIANMYKVGIVALPASAVLFALVYTALGLRGRAKWWTNDIGMSIVTPYLAIAVSQAVLAWAELFNHGMLNTPLPAWIDVGGLFAGTLLLLWRCYVWLRVGRQSAAAGEGGADVDAGPAVPGDTAGG